MPEATLRSIAATNGLDDEGLARARAAVDGFLASPRARKAFGAASVRREAPFALDIGGTTLEGAIDLLAVSGATATVVDYKTGTKEPDAEALERWRLQAVCYAFAVLEALSSVEHVEVVFCRVEADCAEERFVHERVDAAALAGEIDGLVSRLAEGRFAPLRAYEPRTCPGCPALGNLCPVTPDQADGAA